MKLKFTILLFLIGLFSLSVQAQTKTLTGIVSDVSNNEALIGVSIYSGSTGTVTDIDGSYSIEVSPGDTIVYTYVGFTSQEIVYNNESILDITLSPDLMLDEVVVVGYGTQKKSHLTGAISKVTNDDLDQIALSRVDDALVGQVSGVNIAATNGEAGGAPTIRIRGTGSITGSSGPLIVVDGIVVDSDFLGSLDMNDVQSFEILKDAASASIYGSRGANGVVMITTKQGKEGKAKFSYNTFLGFKEARQSDAYTLSVAETAAAQQAATGTLSDRTRYKQLFGDQTNWQDVIFDGGTINNHSLSARGGSAKTKYSIALNYLHDEGVLLTDDFKKYNIRLKLDTKLNDKFSTGVNLNPSYTTRRRFDGSTHDILRQPSWLPVYIDEDNIQYVNRLRDGGVYSDVQIGDYAIQRMFDDYDLETMTPVASGGTDISNTSNTNPAAKILERDRNDIKFKLFGSVYAKYDFTKDLSFKTTLSGNYQNTFRNRWQGVESSRNGASAASLSERNINAIHLITDNYLSYNKSFGAHDVSAILGMSAERFNTTVASVSGTGYTSDLVQTLSNATIISGASSFGFEKRLLSFVSRVNYAYADKYLASVSVRRDGSSIFGPNNKYGTFTAFSAGWNIHREDMFANSKLISLLKVRASYGTTGNDRLNTGNANLNVSSGNNSISTGDALVDHYPYLPLLNSVTAITDGGIRSAQNPINIANSNLQWERSVEINPGIDFGLFNNVVTGSVDYYNRTSDQLLLFNPISATTGFTNALVNLGEVVNSGIEFELRTRNVSSEKFKWSTTFIASRNRNELTDFAASNGQIQNVDTKRAAEWINLEGNPISSFYGWVVDEDIPLEFLNDAYHPIGAQAQDVYVKDLNGDGIIDDDDKTILGNPYPDLVWSITNDFSFGNFDLSFMFQGSHGAEIRNMADQYIFNHFNSGQDYIADTPNRGFIREKIFTNDIIMDASYVALRNLNLGYNFPSGILTKSNVFTSARVYFAAQNLLYVTADDYTGFNPESVDNTSSTTYGYQRGGAPIFRTLSFGLNLTF